MRRKSKGRKTTRRKRRKDKGKKRGPRRPRNLPSGMKDTSFITRTRTKFIKSEFIVPRSHTDVTLNRKGTRAYNKLSHEEKRFIALDGTMGGGVSRKGTKQRGNVVLHFCHTKGKPVHAQYKGVHKLLNKGAQRKRAPTKPQKL